MSNSQEFIINRIVRYTHSILNGFGIRITELNHKATTFDVGGSVIKVRAFSIGDDYTIVIDDRVFIEGIAGSIVITKVDKRYYLYSLEGLSTWSWDDVSYRITIYNNLAIIGLVHGNKICMLANDKNHNRFKLVVNDERVCANLGSAKKVIDRLFNLNNI